MKVRPIIFSREMVEQILYGKKEQTRRVLKIQPDYFINRVLGKPCLADGAYSGIMPGGGGIAIKPKYEKGAVLYIRESWGTLKKYDNVKPSAIAKGSAGNYPQVRYVADPGAAGLLNSDRKIFGKTRPAIFMPKWAARCFLKITDVRIERLQEIDEADAKREGVVLDERDSSLRHPYVMKFMWLWNRLHQGTTKRWDYNPYVWVISFEKLDMTGLFEKPDGEKVAREVCDG